MEEKRSADSRAQRHDAYKGNVPAGGEQAVPMIRSSAYELIYPLLYRVHVWIKTAAI